MFNFLDRLLSSGNCLLLLVLYSHSKHVAFFCIQPLLLNLLILPFLLGSISPILDDPDSKFAMDILKYLQLELRGGKNIYKLLDSINVLCQLIQVIIAIL